MFGGSTYGAGSYGSFTEKSGYRIIAETGSFSLTGNNANLLANRILSAQTGNFILTGNPSNLLKGYKITTATGSFILTGSNVQLSYNRGIKAETGSFILTGNDISIKWTHILRAETGSFILTGGQIYFRKGLIKVNYEGLFGADCPVLIVDNIEIPLSFWSPVTDNQDENEAIIQADQFRAERSFKQYGNDYSEFTGFINLYKYEDRLTIIAKLAEIMQYNNKLVSLKRHADGPVMKTNSGTATYLMQCYPKNLQTLDYRDLLYIRFRSINDIYYVIGQTIIDDDSQTIIDDSGEAFILGGLTL